MRSKHLSKLRLGKVSDIDRILISQLHEQSCILEQHERKIAYHTSIQTRIGWLQLVFGAVTTGLLIYVALLQFQAADKQAAIAFQQNQLEYAKVAPQFSASLSAFETQKSEAVENVFPKDLRIRILRGEASLEEATVIQELEVSRVSPDNLTCVVRLTDYFRRRSDNVTDFEADPVFERVARNPGWFQDPSLKDFVIINPESTMLTLSFRDIFEKTRSKRFIGVNGRLTELPSGSFPRSTLYETVDATLGVTPIRIPGSFRLVGEEPKTRGCRSLFGLSGGRASFF